MSTQRLPHRIMHIVAKDLRLLWPLALGVPLLQGLLALLSYHEVPFSAGTPRTAMLVMAALVIAMVLAVVTVVHQDAPASTRQDWLVRPMRRGDLLLAKCVWIALIIHAPIFVANLAACLAHGFALLPSLRANLLSAVSIAVLFTLPLMALACITRSLLQALLGALGCFVVILLLVNNGPDSTTGTGVRWVLEDLSRVVAVLTLFAVLLLQYFRRTTGRARAVFAGGLLLATLTVSLPWGLAHAISQWFTPRDVAGLSVAYVEGVTVDALPLPGARRLAATRPQGPSADVTGTNDVLIGVPLRIEGRPAGAILHVDRVRVRFLAGDRVLVDRAALPFDLEPGQGAVLRQDVRLTAAEVRRVAAQPVRLELDYAFTALRAVDGGSLGPEDRAPIGELRCATRPLGAGGIEVGCRALVEVPDCLGFEARQDGARVATAFACAPSYEPAALRFSAEPTESVTRQLAFRPAATQTRLYVTRYEPLAHARAAVVVPRLELKALRALP